MNLKEIAEALDGSDVDAIMAASPSDPESVLANACRIAKHGLQPGDEAAVKVIMILFLGSALEHIRSQAIAEEVLGAIVTGVKAKCQDPQCVACKQQQPQ